MTDAEDIALLDEIATNRLEIERLRRVTVDMGERIEELIADEKARRIAASFTHLGHDMRLMLDDGILGSSDDFGHAFAAGLMAFLDKLSGGIGGHKIDEGCVLDILFDAAMHRKIERDGPPKVCQN